MGGFGEQDGTPRTGEGQARRLGGYEVLERLGGGGMGSVYKARQVAMDRLVALKLLPAKLAADEAFVQRFLREARSAGKLRHPHIVQAYDAGFADGCYYFAMEYVDGEGLDAVLCREGPLPPARALAILKQVCSALAAAHEAGIVHRDIKPSNVMLDAGGSARVTDFGLAKQIHGDVAVTQTGQSLGTPLYMAPEVAAGEPADARSDLYSLGATFYQLLSGRPPFEGKTAGELIVKHATHDPPPLAGAAPHVDRRLCAIVDRLLRKRPAERPASAQALLAELDALGELRVEASPDAGALVRPGAPTVTLPPGKRLERQFAARRLARRQRRQRRRKATVVVAVASALVLAATGIVWVATRGSGQGRGRAGAQATSAGADPRADDPRERVAKDVIQRAEYAAGSGNWRALLPVLDRLDREFADTAAYAARRADLADLRAKALAALRRLPATSTAPPAAPGGWVAMFDGKTLDGWHVIDEFPTEWGGRGGQVYAQGGLMWFARERTWAGVAWLRDFPAADYEVEFEAQRVEGNSTFCGVLFPAYGHRGMLDVGGFGGTVVGLAGLDGKNANANPTTAHVEFDNGRWYRFRLRLERTRLQLFVDDKRVVDFDLEGHQVAYPRMLGPIKPFGFCSSTPKAALRNIRLRRLAP